MRRKTKITFLFFIYAINVVYSQNVASSNHIKYWYMRDRLVKYFMVIGKNYNQSIPATVRNYTDCNFEEGGKDSLFNDVPVPSTIRGFAMSFTDSPHQIGLYLATLATEYKLLSMNNQSTQNVLNELFHALYAINRMDDCENRYPWDGTASETYVKYYHKNDTYTPNQSNLNGKCLRSDYFRGNINDLENFPGFETKYRKQLNQVLSYYHPNVYGNTFGDPKPLLQSTEYNGGLLNPNIGHDYYLENTSAEDDEYDYFGGSKLEKLKTWSMLSQDHISQLLFGLAFVAKYVDISVSTGESFQDGETSIANESGNIVKRLVKYMADCNYSLNRIDNVKLPNRVGGDAEAYSWGFASAGKWILKQLNRENEADIFFDNTATTIGWTSWRTLAGPISTIESGNLWIYLNLAVVNNATDYLGLLALPAAFPFSLATLSPVASNLRINTYSQTYNWEAFYPLAHGLLHDSWISTNQSEIIEDINQMPCKGPSNFTKGFGSGWCTPRRYHNSGCNDETGNFNGLEWMLLFNMLTLHEKLENTGSDWDNLVYQNLMDREISLDLPFEVLPGIYVGTPQLPAKISAFNTIKYTGIIASNSDVLIRAGNEVQLPPYYEANNLTIAYAEPIVCNGENYNSIFKTASSNPSQVEDFENSPFANYSSQIPNVNYYSSETNSSTYTDQSKLEETSIERLLTTNTSVLPNPFTNNLFINCREESEIYVFNAYGALVYNTNGIRLELNTQEWASGLYTVVIKNSKLKYTTYKVVK